MSLVLIWLMRVRSSKLEHVFVQITNSICQKCKIYLSQLQNIFVSIVASRSDPCLQALGPHLGCQRSPLLLNLSSRFPAPGTFGLPPYTKMTITSMQPVR